MGTTTMDGNGRGSAPAADRPSDGPELRAIAFEDGLGTGIDVASNLAGECRLARIAYRYGDDTEARIAAARSLLERRGDLALPFIMALTADPHEGLKAQSLRLLCEVVPAWAAVQAEQMLGSDYESPYYRGEALAWLYELHPLRGYKLAQGLKSDSPAALEQVCKDILAKDPPAADAAIPEELNPARVQRVLGLAETLREALYDEELAICSEAILALADTHHGPAFESLVLGALTAHPEASVRQYALTRLHEIGAGLGADLAAEMLSDPDDDVRALALELCGGREPPGAAP